MIQNVSVGADYDALDLVNAEVPYGLSHPDLSLVSVLNIEETNIKVLEWISAGTVEVEGVGALDHSPTYDRKDPL